MPGLGTLMNVIFIIIGGLLGMLLGSRIKKNYQESLCTAAGISVLFLGIGGAMEKMLSIDGNALVSGQTLLIIASLFIGVLIGEILNIEGAFERFGEWLKEKTKSSGDNSFVDAFVTASFTTCIGAMAIVGAIRDGISGDYSILFAKSVLDLVIVAVITASKGKGAIFSAIPIALLQGSVTLLARFIEPIMTQAALANLSLVGSVLIFCVGLNLVWGKKVKVANFLPSLIIAVIASYIM